MIDESELNALVAQAQEAGAIYESYNQSGDQQILEQAVRLWLPVLKHPLLSSLPGPYRAAVYNDSGLVFYTHYQVGGHFDSLDLATTLFEQAEQLTRDTHRRRASVLNNLSAALQARAVRLNAIDDLERSITVSQESLNIIPADASERGSYLTNLTGGLYERYHRTGLVDDLNAAINASQTAIQFTTKEEMSYVPRSNNLAVLYHERYGRLGDLKDLYSSIESHRQVVEARKAASSEQSAYLNNLGGALNDLYRRTNDLKNLEEAIEVLRQATSLAPLAMPNRAGFLNNLGNALCMHYLHTRSLPSLQESIACQREAATSSMESPNYRASFLTGLGTSLSEYFQRTGETSSSNEAVEACEQALALTPTTSPKYASRLNNLARVLRDRYQRTGQGDDLSRGQSFYRQACQSGFRTQSEVVVVAGYNWGMWALQRSAWSEAVEAFECASQSANDLFQRQALRVDRAMWLQEAQKLPALAAYALAKISELTRAVVTLENGRVRLLSASLEIERQELERLKEDAHPQLYERFVSSVEQIGQLERQEIQDVNFADQEQLAATVERARIELADVIRVHL